MAQLAADDHRIVGVWKLVAQVYEDVETGERFPVFGEHSKGRQIATRDGRWIALATGDAVADFLKKDSESAEYMLKAYQMAQ